ncbi:hypothetical protein FVE85_0345 [Porphyridium purpureum]|uniref:Uncharacterized protein n=1 Tax=Porphyridium purpureum TaxID=35688 RepID=A0A5J4YZ71_PORPP|nr:hypothetical protein FVE85_0345 [Porphyridium purpureum]|eukprot:POR7783..scf208_2
MDNMSSLRQGTRAGRASQMTTLVLLVMSMVWIAQAVPINTTYRSSKQKQAEALPVLDSLISTAALKPMLTVRQFSDSNGLRSRQFETSVQSHRATSLALNKQKTGVYVAGSMSIQHLDSLSNAAVGTSQDAFLMFVSESNFEPHWVHQFGSTGDDFFGDVVVSSSGDVYAFGWTRGTFASSPNPNAGAKDCLMVKFNENGQVQTVRTFGSSGDDYITRVHYDADDDAFFVSGHLGGDEMLADFKALDPSYPQGRGFVAKFDSQLELVVGLYTGHTKHDVGTGITFDGNGGFYFSFATFSPRGTVYSVVQKIDKHGNTLWTADTSSMTVAPAHGLSMWYDESTTPPRPLVVLSGALYANEAYKLSIIALRADDGGLVQVVSGCCESGFAKASGGMVVTSGNYIVALGHHAEQQNGLGEKSPVLVSVTPTGHAVSKKLSSVVTEDHDVRMSHPIVLNGTIYFASTKGADFTLHAYAIAGVFDNETIDDAEIGGILVDGAGAGENAGAGNSPGSQTGGGEGELGVGAIIGIVVGAAAVALLLAGLLILGLYGGRNGSERDRRNVRPENPPPTPFDVLSLDDNMDADSRGSHASLLTPGRSREDSQEEQDDIDASQSNDGTIEDGTTVVYRYDPI